MDEEILVDFFDWTGKYMSLQAFRPLNQNESHRDLHHHSSFLIPHSKYLFSPAREDSLSLA